MKLRIYAYKNCDTCRRALKWLSARVIPHEVIPIRDQPPTVPELKQALAATGEIRRLLNTSGGDYKSLGLKDKLPSMGEADALALLAANGNLVKRPFLIGKEIVLLGFKEPEWESVL